MLFMFLGMWLLLTLHQRHGGAKEKEKEKKKTKKKREKKHYFKLGISTANLYKRIQVKDSNI